MIITKKQFLMAQNHLPKFATATFGHDSIRALQSKLPLRIKLDLKHSGIDNLGDFVAACYESIGNYKYKLKTSKNFE